MNTRHELSSNLYGDLVVFGGTANQPLTSSVCLALGLQPSQATVHQFAISNTFVQLQHSVRGKDVFLPRPPTTT